MEPNNSDSKSLDRYSGKIFLLVVLCICFYNFANSQVLPVDSLKEDSLRILAGKGDKPEDNLKEEYDIADLARNLMHPKKKHSGLPHNRSGISLLPNVGANPTVGFQLGVKAVAGVKLGENPRTLMSVAATSLAASTKGNIYFYFSHNIFTDNNKWNLQGNLVTAKIVTPDYGLGIGNAAGQTGQDSILTNPARTPYRITSFYFNLREKLYKEVITNLFFGAGVSFEIRGHILEKNVDSNQLTPYEIYSKRNDFNFDHYASNGLLFSVQYITRDNQNRPYKGLYVAADFKTNQTWMGSAKNAVLFTTDFRKYISLSQKNPQHIIALWNWGSYLLSGTLPYLELPGTGTNSGSRSGRGYTVTYFKGTRYNCSEMEYRFPVTKNKFLSGVTFFNLQTANDAAGTKLFQRWQPGYGAGLRLLFNKTTRTNLCLDYAFGKYGRQGFFLGLNDAF